VGRDLATVAVDAVDAALAVELERCEGLGTSRNTARVLEGWGAASPVIVGAVLAFSSRAVSREMGSDLGPLGWSGGAGRSGSATAVASCRSGTAGGGTAEGGTAGRGSACDRLRMLRGGVKKERWL
jgi:hypothetical protein